MSIEEIRHQTGLSQAAFAKKYHIGLRNLQNWEQGVSKPPPYLPELLSRVVAIDYRREELDNEQNEQSEVFGTTDK